MRKLLAASLALAAIFTLTACEEPKTICVKSHTNWVWMMVPVTTFDGKNTHVTMMTQWTPIFVCDKEGPNPKYHPKKKLYNNG